MFKRVSDFASTKVAAVKAAATAGSDAGQVAFDSPAPDSVCRIGDAVRIQFHPAGPGVAPPPYSIAVQRLRRVGVSESLSDASWGEKRSALLKAVVGANFKVEASEELASAAAAAAASWSAAEGSEGCYNVRVVAADGAVGESGRFFVKGPVEVVQPGPGFLWLCGSKQVVQWESAGCGAPRVAIDMLILPPESGIATAALQRLGLGGGGGGGGGGGAGGSGDADAAAAAKATPTGEAGDAEEAVNADDEAAAALQVIPLTPPAGIPNSGVAVVTVPDGGRAVCRVRVTLLGDDARPFPVPGMRRPSRGVSAPVVVRPLQMEPYHHDSLYLACAPVADHRPARPAAVLHTSFKGVPLHVLAVLARTIYEPPATATGGADLPSRYSITRTRFYEDFVSARANARGDTDSASVAASARAFGSADEARAVARKEEESVAEHRRRVAAEEAKHAEGGAEALVPGTQHLTLLADFQDVFLYRVAGLRAQLFLHRPPGAPPVYIAVFKGTDPNRSLDLIQDLRIAMDGHALNYVRAGTRWMVEMIARHGITGDGLVFTGHSLGAHVAAEISLIVNRRLQEAAAGAGPIAADEDLLAGGDRLRDPAEEDRAWPRPNVPYAPRGDARPDPALADAVVFCLPHLREPRARYTNLTVVNVVNDLVSYRFHLKHDMFERDFCLQFPREYTDPLALHSIARIAQQLCLAHTGRTDEIPASRPSGK